MFLNDISASIVKEAMNVSNFGLCSELVIPASKGEWGERERERGVMAPV